MNKHRQSFCLNMIVKNEAPVIRRCLDSVRPIIDYWVIVDTGSTDGTQDVIRKDFGDLPGELIERPWVDFAHNRSEALNLARGRGDYLLVIDADERLVITEGFEMPLLSADSYDIEVRCGAFTCARKQLLRNSSPWHYEGVLHEYPCCHEARSEEFLPGLWIASYRDGARARNPQTYLRDAQTLERALREEPNNARYVFYLAQTYLLLKEFELALRQYRRRVEMGGQNDEVWFSLYQTAQLEQVNAKLWPEVMQQYLTAYEFMPDRAEPLFHIGMKYQAKGDYQTAHHFFSLAMQIPHPGNNRLFVERHVYDYLLPLEYAVACHYVGVYSAAIATYNRLLRQDKVPAMLIDKVIANRRFSIDALKPAAETSTEPSPIKICVPFRDPGPELDECIESILQQNLQLFAAVFIDDGSLQDHAARIPLEDPRFSMIRHKKPVGPRACIDRFVREHCGADDLVLPLQPHERLAQAASLGQIRTEFESCECLLLYGQHRLAAGELGDAEPAPDVVIHNQRGAALVGRSAVFFRARLMLGAEEVPTAAAVHGLTDSLVHAAGFPRSRFSDTVFTIVGEPGTAGGKLHESTRANWGLAGSAEVGNVHRLAPAFRQLYELPKISCLMVTHGRLALARRAIRSYADQTYPKRELVIVSDGEFRYRRALERYVAYLDLDSVRFVYPEADQLPLGQLRNISLDAADGDIICQWDDDDCYHPERLAVQLAHMLEGNSRACYLTDHLQLLEQDRALVWVDWTLGGRSGEGQLLPGTVMAFKDRRFRYPETGPYVNRGEDSVFLDELYHTVPVVPLSGMGYIYLYTYHGGNTFSKEHHYNLRIFSASRSELNEKVETIRQAIAYYPVPRPITVVGRDGVAFVLNSDRANHLITGKHQ
jgi:glycosyltransferase involved in cell wall biosynthesis